jgi:outer membrane protein assembly factor BamB
MMKTLYYSGSDGVMNAYDYETDLLAWRYALKRHSIQRDAEGEVFSLVWDERVYCLWDGIAFALDAHTGQLIWMQYLRQHGLKPLLGHSGSFTFSKGFMVAAWHDRLFILDSWTGKLLRQRRIQYSFRTDLEIAMEEPLPGVG